MPASPPEWTSATRAHALYSTQERALSATVEPDRSLVTVTHVIYGLHAASLITGIGTAALIVFASRTGSPAIIAVVLGYVKRGDARGRGLGLPFRRQSRPV